MQIERNPILSQPFQDFMGLQGRKEKNEKLIVYMYIEDAAKVNCHFKIEQVLNKKDRDIFL